MEFDEKELRREIAFAIRNIHGKEPGLFLHYRIFTYYIVSECIVAEPDVDDTSRNSRIQKLIRYPTHIHVTVRLFIDALKG